MQKGLLDFFGKDYEDPRTQGLLQFGLGLMQQGGYQDRPVSLGQAFGAAGQQGMQAYQQAVAEKQKKEQLAQAKALQDLQAQQAKMNIKASEQSFSATEKQQLAQSRFQNAKRMGFKDMAGNPMSKAQIDALRFAAYPDLASYQAKKEIDQEFVSPDYGLFSFGGNLYQTVNGQLGDALVTEDKPIEYRQYGNKVFIPDEEGEINFDSPVYTVDPEDKEDKYVSFGRLVFKQSGGEINFDEPEFTIPDDSTPKKGFVTFVDPKTQDVQTIREDDPKADEFAEKGYRIIESSQATGSVDELVGMTKPVITTLAKDIIAGKDFVAQAEELKNSYDPQYLTRLGKLKNIAFSEIEKLDPSLLSDDQEEYLKGYTNFATQAYGMVNDYIKSITGAAMSVEEAKRILKAIPNIDEMSPTQFVTSLNKVIHQAQLAKARNIYMLENGITPTATKSNVYDDDLGINVEQDHFFSISIRSGDGKNSEMDRILNREQEKLAKELVSSRGFSKERADDMATRQIMDKYGYSPNAYLSL